MREQISLMLQKNSISEISPDTPGFYLNAFMVRKASGGWHPFIDLKQLNHHIDAPHFCMHTISSVLSTVKKGDYAFMRSMLYIKRQVIPSACMEALMQHYQAAGFSREVSKFAAGPTCRRPSTNRIYDDRWLRFTTWATGRGFDQTIKGYRSCLASVLSRTGRAAEVQAKTISDMVISMELQRPRLTPGGFRWKTQYKP